MREDGHVVAVRFSYGGNPSRDDLLSLRYFSHMRGIDFYGTPVDSGVLAELSHLSAIESINLNGAAIDSEALRQLKGFTNLRWLGLGASES